MSMENLGPYTNFHEINQDWFLQEFNKLIVQWKAMQKNFDNLHDAFNDLKSYVQNYFKNLNVQEEINNKLDSMIADGTLLNIIKPTISNVTSNWLDNHITNPTNPPIDTSLSVSGAAADAKIVGDNIDEINTDLNDIKNRGITPERTNFFSNIECLSERFISFTKKFYPNNNGKITADDATGYENFTCTMICSVDGNKDYYFVGNMNRWVIVENDTNIFEINKTYKRL